MQQLVIPGLLWFCAIGCGLLGGLYFAFSTFIMTSLGRIGHGPFEAGRPAGGEQLLGIGAGTWSAGHRERHIQPAVGAARYALFPGSGGADLGGVEQFLMLRHSAFLLERQRWISACPGHLGKVGGERPLCVVITC